MNDKSKSILALLGTLLIGMVLGALISNNFIKKKIDRFKNPKYQAAGMKKHFHRMTDATELQKVKIDSIIDLKSSELRALMENREMEKKQLMEETVESLKPFLEPEQITKLENHIERFRKKKSKRSNRK